MWYVNIHCNDQASGRASTEYYIPLARYGNIASFSCGRLERSKELENKAQIPSPSKDRHHVYSGHTNARALSIHALIVITNVPPQLNLPCNEYFEKYLMGCNVSCSPVDRQRRFRRTCSLHNQVSLKTTALVPSSSGNSSKSRGIITTQKPGIVNRHGVTIWYLMQYIPKSGRN